ncbi:putative pentatricopeptide repeat-containing protein At1g13630 isoform X1 [Lycium barbarum]|uniref:putative pentatricopeptide repeat-containing protein At1g13630 isoform X1 n=1 Tax=Lycium barbarum TaxID=112863 RepID=UPI00293F671F|nr:putative pentatricopeptide repeat-containing protein At1g13630 isoform X1 [Lycium barbarum]XP_060215012.1 putative pentatricopeptide repeat-containing protein At1g13630 isoform X1 [Lycium barbarum]XP_060215013.1 putative pentatricopeptide repeat-containing protein At1g13630 isoform X1 [Lycium barbarum]XP_060215014.1 putative pentatricopeptide repeat-containing protein At1g13630 isoform X1 [Lycium barbarum]XP_060215015.1 putative pentatricopeptide repeat-containing protein At1g13630 isoform X
MLRLTLKSPLKPPLISSLFLLNPSFFTTTNLAVNHREPPPSATGKSRILSFFLQNHTKGSTNHLQQNPCFKNLIFELNSLEIEGIVEKLSVGNTESALEFFFLLRNDYGFKHSRVSYIVIAHILAKKQRFRALKFHLQYLVQQEGSGSAHSICELLSSRFQKWDSNHVVWDMLASAYSWCQMVNDALYVFAKMKDSNIHASIITYNNLLYSLRHTDNIWDVYDDIKASGINPSKYTNSIVIDGLCKQFLMQKAVDFLRETECRESGPCVVAFNTLMSSSCKMGSIDVAKSFFCMMFKCGLHPNVYSYNILIHGLSVAGAMEEALEFTDDMKKHGLEPNQVTYNVLAKGFHLLGMMNGVWKFVNEMLHKGIDPDIFTYTMLICGYYNDEGIKLKEETGVHASDISDTMLLSSLCKSGRLDEALNLFHEIESSGHKPDPIMYSILISGLCKQGLVEMAFQLYNDMLCCKRILPNIVAHRSILKSFCERGYICEARVLFDAFINCDLMDDVVLGNIMIDGYAKLGDIGEAVQVYQLITGKGIMPTIVTFNSLIYGFCKARKFDDARNWVDTIYSHGLIPSSRTYTILMDAYGEEGKIEAVFELLEEMKARAIEPTHVTYTVIMKCLCRRRQMHESVRILKGMLPDGFQPDEIFYNTIIKKLCEARDMKGAFRLHKEMAVHKLQPSRVTYNILLNGLCTHGELKNAEELFSTLQDVGLMKCDYTILIKAYCAKGSVDKAVVLFQKMIEKGFEISIRDYSAVINRLCKRNLLAGVKIFLRMMLFHGISVDSQICFVMLKSFNHIRDRNSVFQLSSLMMKCGLDTDYNCG